LLKEFSAVAVLGPRQIGKTTLAQEIAREQNTGAIYLDLESPSDLSKLNEPELYFELHKGHLVVPDEIQRTPELFSVLRVVIDQRRKEGFRKGQFLILGSASLDLLKQSSESLAGRIAYLELSGLTVSEIEKEAISDQQRLWLKRTFSGQLFI
jgi:predicted AAA+ superfamily ATPase